MRSTRRLALAVVFALNCTSQPSASPTPPPTPTIASSPTTVVAPAGFTLFTSRALPYGVCIPQGWQVREDWVGFAGARGDAFIGGQPGDLPLVISILAEDATADSAAYIQAVIDNLRGTGIGPEILDPLTVDGVAASRMRFARLTADDQRYTVQEVVWAKNGRGWVAAASSSPTQAANVALTLTTMLGCLRAGPRN